MTIQTRAVASAFCRVLAGEPPPVPPIWLMRQAGRYHAHYQRLRAIHSFDTLCRTPELAAQVALGPIEDFDFDAAILFSDLLFPLDALGLGVSYDRGRPVVDGPLTLERVESFPSVEEALSQLSFQRDAVSLTRAQLSPSKGLIGFIGGPWTLFAYSQTSRLWRFVEAGSRVAPDDETVRLYNAFATRIVPLLIENARQQLEAGADIVMMFDTAAGALPPDAYSGDVARDVRAIATAHPGRIGYYARDFSDAHETAAGFDTIPLAGVGLDMHRDLAAHLRARRYGGQAALRTANSSVGAAPVGAGFSRPNRRSFIHGNMDNRDLLLTGAALEQAIERFVAPLRALDAETRRGWMCGLGHGVLPGTPEESVRRFVTVIRETFS